jgi:hypothetical protein
MHVKDRIYDMYCTLSVIGKINMAAKCHTGKFNDSALMLETAQLV